jgi:hypothetical protein
MKPRLWLQMRGIVWLMHPRDKETAQWLGEVAPKGAQWFGPALVIECWFVDDFVNAAHAADAEVTRFK